MLKNITDIELCVILIGPMSRNLFYSPVDPAHLKKERERARKLRKTPWWQAKLRQGICHYCGKHFGAKDLTMDHIVALGRGGTSTKGNVVVSCKNCNTDKSHRTPAEILLDRLKNE
jgi:5-methylcytosine-specific restriction endonuclease McrA